MNGSPVVLINRTQRILSFVADGHHHSLLPGENYGFNEPQAGFAKRQNPLMGSEDYVTMECVSLIGIKDVDPCDPIDESKAIERFDRLTMPGAQQVIIVPVRHQVRGRLAPTAGPESMAAGD